MSYELDPQIVRLFPFQSESGALAAVDIAFGPIVVSTKLYRSEQGFFLSLPSQHNEVKDRWYDQVHIADVGLKMKAQVKAVTEYERLCREKLVAV